MVIQNDIFFLTKEPKSDKVIKSELGSFEQKEENSHTITPFVLSFEEENPILIELEKDSMSFLLLGHEVTRDFKKSPTTIYSKYTPISIDEDDYKKSTYKEVFDYQSTQDILIAPYRARFVISNGGRIISLSIYDKKSRVWKIVKTFIWDIEKITKEHRIVFSIDTPSKISNITSNF